MVFMLRVRRWYAHIMFMSRGNACSEADSIYVCNRREAETALAPSTELSGYGAGAWASGKDAEDPRLVILQSNNSPHG
jgi:hypothetical protein